MTGLTFKSFIDHTRTRGAGLACLPLLAALVLSCLLMTPAAAQTAQAPVARPVARPGSTDARPERTPPAEPATTTPAPARAPLRTHGPSGVAPAVAPAAPSPAAAPSAATPRPAPPRNVVTVVHRLDGWKLLALIASKRNDKLVVESMPNAAGVHTNIVAGFVSDDGRTVIARLPSAEAEVVAPGLAQGLLPGAGPWAGMPAFTLIRSDGKRVEAKFIGMDAATGLSLLESAEPIFAEAPKAAPRAPAVGQLLRLYAPAPAPALAPPAAAAAPPAPVALPPGVIGDMGDTEVVYLSMGQTTGKLTDVKRAPSGKLVEATVYSRKLAPERAGAIATTDAGDFVGIVGDSGHTESRIVLADAIHQARARVLARTRRVPGPLLGIRGEAASKFNLEQIARGWPREFALPFMNNPQGVLLTKVAPGAPGALAGLKPGDIITRVGEREVGSVDEFSLLLREAGVGARLDFTVLRAFEKMPLSLTVELDGADDPEWRAQVERMLAGTPEPDEPYGLKLAGLTPRSAAELKVRGGLLVISVIDGGRASRAGLLPRDVIETANGRPLTLDQWRRLTTQAQPEPLSLVVVREGRRLSLTLPRTED